MKKVMFTVLTGGYDNLIDPTVISKGWDYICFTDNPRLKSKVWKIIEAKNENNLNAYQLGRIYKLNPHPHLRGYDISLHIDANVKVRYDLNKVEKEIIDPNVDLNLAKHPKRTCLYNEAIRCIKTKKAKRAHILKQVAAYKEEGMPKNWGLYSCGFQYRNLKSKELETFSEKWVKEILKHTVRDQISFPYVLWKNNSISINVLEWRTIYGIYFKRRRHRRYNKG